jgi:hypothetical protein
MSVLLLRRGFNLVENALSATPSPAADSLFPTANAGDRIPASIFRFGSLTAAPSIYWDMDEADDKGEFETWASGSPDGWTEDNTGGSDITQTSVGAEVKNGVSAAKMTCAGGGRAYGYHEFTCRAGARLRLDCWGRGDGGTGLARFTLYNVTTGNGSLGAANWSAGILAFALTSTSSTTYQHLVSDITVEPYETCRSHEVTMRIVIANVTNGTTSFADSVQVFPAVNFASIHGHNIDPACTLKLQGGDTVGGISDLATFTVAQPSFYTTCTTAFNRYYKLLLSGTNSTASGPIYFGEACIGDALTLGTKIRLPMSPNYSDPRAVIPMRWGSQTYSMGQHPSRTLPFTIQATSMTERNEILNELFRRSRGGGPVVMVPHDGNSHNEVIYGRISSELPHEWAKHDVVNLSSSIEELPFPFITG